MVEVDDVCAVATAAALAGAMMIGAEPEEAATLWQMEGEGDECRVSPEKQNMNMDDYDDRV